MLAHSRGNSTYPAAAPEEVRPWGAMRRSLQRQLWRPAHGELVGVALVLTAALLTVWGTLPRISVDIEALVTAPEALGFVHAGPPQRSLVGALAPSAPPAPWCAAGQAPAFAGRLAELKRRLAERMGDAIECEHLAEGGLDLVQQTSTGLAFFTPAANVATFTDGWRHWALTPADQVLDWEGSDARPSEL